MPLTDKNIASTKTAPAAKNTPTKAAKVRTAGDTSKAKPAIAAKLGIELKTLETMSICWIPFPMTSIEKDVMTRVAEARSTDTKEELVYAILSKKARETFDKDFAGYKAEADTIVKKVVAEKTIEQLEKEAEAAQKKLAETLAALKMKKG